MGRQTLWERLTGGVWDLLIIGGGITGAGILRRAARLGLRVALVEQQDFAWGTSSRSSKLVHGGLRYLREGKLHLTWESVRERERLLQVAPGLIQPLDFLIPLYEGERPGRWTYQAGLALYDLLAGQWHAHHLPREALLAQLPELRPTGLTGGLHYLDAQTDDARLVLRLLAEARHEQALVMNYVKVASLLRQGGRVVGAHLSDQAGAAQAEVRARVVVNATGAWADTLWQEERKQLRPLRGSHLIFPQARFPLRAAVAFPHPEDRRPVFAFPWEGVTLVGTTDLDHAGDLGQEPRISRAEVAYLMAMLDDRFPTLGLGPNDLIATYAGVRPVISSGLHVSPSQESRDHLVQETPGLLTVTGGKLTTFDVIARDVLARLRPYFPARPPMPRRPLFRPAPALVGLSAPLQARLGGRYGAEAAELLHEARAAELSPVPGSQTLWAELRWALRHEAVVHLDDLLLRRVRLGLLLPEGACALLPQVKALCQAELGWDDATWTEEESRYRALHERHYGIPTSE